MKIRGAILSLLLGADVPRAFASCGGLRLGGPSDGAVADPFEAVLGVDGPERRLVEFATLQPCARDDFKRIMGSEFEQRGRPPSHVQRVSDDDTLLDLDGSVVDLNELEPHHNLFSMETYDVSEDGRHVIQKSTGERIEIFVYGNDLVTDLDNNMHRLRDGENYVVATKDGGGDFVDIQIRNIVRGATTSRTFRRAGDFYLAYASEEDASQDGISWDAGHEDDTLATDRVLLKGNTQFVDISVAVTIDQALKNKYPGWGPSQVQSIFASARERFDWSYVMSYLWFAPQASIALFPRISLGPIDETSSLDPFTVTGCETSVYGAVDIYEDSKKGRDDANAWFLLTGTEFQDTEDGSRRLGCANQNGFCDCTRRGYTGGRAFAVLNAWTTDYLELGTAFAHELGHTFGATHGRSSSNTIMHNELTPGRPVFSNANSQAMSDRIKNYCGPIFIRTINDPSRNGLPTDEMRVEGCLTEHVGTMGEE